MPDTLRDLLRSRLGVETFSRVSPVGFQAGVAVAQLMPQDPNRVGAWIVNLSVNNVFVAPFNSVSATRGVLVGPSGGNVILTFQDDLSVVGVEWFMIAAAAGSDMLVVEYLLLPQHGETLRAG